MFTIEPGIYMPDFNFDDSPKAKGLGIRSEDQLLHACGSGGSDYSAHSNRGTPPLGLRANTWGYSSDGTLLQQQAVGFIICYKCLLETHCGFLKCCFDISSLYSLKRSIFMHKQKWMLPLLMAAVLALSACTAAAPAHLPRQPPTQPRLPRQQAHGREQARPGRDGRHVDRGAWR